MEELPSGTVTFLFTDLESSTRLWEEHPEAMQDALARHDVILRDAIAVHGGHVVKTTGDGAHGAFVHASSAVSAAVAAQLALKNERWGDVGELRVRMGVHTGPSEQREGDYYGTALNRAARLMSVAHGGQIVVSLATVELIRDAMPDGVVLVDLGEHRLRDLGRPERLFQVVHPGLDGEFAPLRTLDAFPGNLPLQASSFVGRDIELVRAADALARSRVVTLTGVGGVGKTRLALQVAGEVLPRFPDGAWLCELASVRDPGGVVDGVAGVFRVSARPGLTLEESLVAYLRDQALLMVLDNCEHVLRPVARLVVAIEAACGQVRVLATSREGLNIAGEQILVVPSLGLPGDDIEIDAIGECEAVRLFAERAGAVKADFVVDATNQADVLAVCTRLDGIALAIELAAARIPAMSPRELARRLDRRFRLLSGGGRVAIERHQTLRAAIDWSYELLTAPEQQLLARLAVFSGGCTLEAVEAVCAGDPIDGDEVFELLASLVARSLVEADAGAETRYRLLETIRQYGEERLAETGDTDRLRARHCDFYTEFSGMVQRQSLGPEHVEWGARLARDHDNLLAAMAFALDTQDVARAVRLLSQLPSRGVQVNDVVVFDPEPVLALPGAADEPGFAHALMLAGYQTWAQGDGAGALEFCEQAMDAERRLGPTPDSYLSVSASELRGYVALDAGAPREAVDHCLEAARHASAHDLPGIAAGYLGTAAQTLLDVDPAAARQQGTQALALARQSGMPLAITRNLAMLAQILAAEDPHRARALLDEALQLEATLGYNNPIQAVATVMTAARIHDWPLTLRTASRALQHHLRSGALTLLYLAGVLNVVARSLVEHQPEPAAVLQGAVSALMRRFEPGAQAPTPAAVAPQPGTDWAFVTAARRDTTQMLVAALGDARLRELRVEGEAMDADQACVYARAHIDQYLTVSADEL